MAFRKRRISDDEVRLVPQLRDLPAAEVSVAVQIFPLKVVDVDAPVTAPVFLQDKYLPFDRCLGTVKLRGVLFEQRRLVRRFILLALRCITRRNQFLQSQFVKLGCEKTCKIAPFGVVARQQDGLSPEHVGVVFEVGIHFHLYVLKLSVKLIVFSRLCFFQITICHRVAPLRCLTSCLLISSGIKYVPNYPY